MQNKKEQDAKKCWACKTILVENNKLGLCPKCVNKGGTPVAAIALIGISFAGKQLLKNGGKVVGLLAKLPKLL
jgi:hypothetical protein